MSEIFLNILGLSFSMIPIIGLLLILGPLISKIYSSTLQYWIWLVITMRLLLPFSPGEGWPALFKLPSFDKLIIEAPVIGESTSIKGELVNTISSSSEMNLSFLEVIAFIYFVGFSVFLIYKLICYIGFMKNIKKYYRKPSAWVINTAEEIGQRINFTIKKNSPQIYICRKIPGPMVVGAVKPVLLLPDENYDDVKLRMIMSHEMIHMKRRDTLFKLLLMIISAIHWFNPFVHLMSRRASRDIEISCDTKVLHEAETEEKKIYSLMILDMASPKTGIRSASFLTTFGTGKESLEARIKNIFSSPKKKKGTIPLILVILLAIFFGAAMQINSPSVYAEKAEKVVNVGESEDEPTIDIPEGLVDMEVMPKSEAIKANTGGEDLQTRGSEKKSSENQPGALQDAPDKVTDQVSVPAEIVVIDLNQLNFDEKLDEAVAAE